MGAEIVPFGKYKGQPVTALAADSDYCEWLMSQPWFRDRWPNVYNVVINYGAEPQDSPEHNQMQAAFLDEARCLAVADRLGMRKSRSLAAAWKVAGEDPLVERFRQHVELTESDMWAEDAEFEVKGWDVVYTIEPARIDRRITSPPPCVCHCDDDHGYYCQRRAIEGEPGKVRTEWQYHCDDKCPWRDREIGYWLTTRHQYSGPGRAAQVHVELKPDLGDDYPSVLRQVNSYRYERGLRCVIARRSAFDHVTWDQVVRIFDASGIDLIAEHEIATASPDNRKD